MAPSVIRWPQYDKNHVMQWHAHQGKVSTMSTGAVRFSLGNSHHFHQRLLLNSIHFSRPHFEKRPTAAEVSPSSPLSCSRCWCAAAPLSERSRLSRPMPLGTPPARQTRTGRSSRTRSCASASGGRHSSACAGTSDHTWNTWKRFLFHTRTWDDDSNYSSSRTIAEKIMKLLLEVNMAS